MSMKLNGIKAYLYYLNEKSRCNKKGWNEYGHKTNFCRFHSFDFMQENGKGKILYQFLLESNKNKIPQFRTPLLN